MLPLGAGLAVLVDLLLHGIDVQLHLGHIFLLDHIKHLLLLYLVVLPSQLLHHPVVLLAIEFIRIPRVAAPGRGLSSD